MVQIKNRAIIGIMLSISFIVMIHYNSSFLATSVGAISSFFLYPVLYTQKICVDQVWYWLKNRQDLADLKKEYQRLVKEKDELLATVIEAQGMNHYANNTAELQQFKKRYERTGERVVQVLARHLSDNNQFFLLNAGASQGIEKDMVALCGNCLIGKVDRVYPWYCKVTLITDITCKVGVMCAQTGSLGIHVGQNRADCAEVMHVSHLAKVSKGDMILSSGEGLIFPQGFCLGMIDRLECGDLFYAIKVVPVIDFYSLQYCTLLAKSVIEEGTI